jgi:lambda family phage holin
MALTYTNHHKEPPRREGPDMSDRNTDQWSSLVALFQQHSPLLYGAIASIILAFLRQIYEGEHPWRRMTLEAVLCGALSVVLVSGLHWFSVPQSAATFVGGMVGFLGVEKVRWLALRWFDHGIQR